MDIECNVADVYVGNAINFMILDTGSPRNVAGETWLSCFLEILDENDYQMIQKSSTNTRYKFGCGSVFEAMFQI